MNNSKIRKDPQLATLCYVQNEGDTLMICKDKDQNSVHYGKFNGLGGKVEQGEAILECLYREVFEESGLEIIDPENVGVLLFPNFTESKDWIVFVYVANTTTRNFIESAEGSLSWVNNENILNLPLWEGDKEFLPLVFGGKKFLGRFNYFEGDLKDFILKTIEE